MTIILRVSLNYTDVIGDRQRNVNDDDDDDDDDDAYRSLLLIGV